MATKNQPVLSIVIPVYNAANNIKNITLKILNQSFKNFELILVNDKSTDNSGNVIKDLAKKDTRIKLINRKINGGASSARNDGIKKSSGNYLMMFDADDNIDSDLISIMVKKMENSGADLVVSGAKYNILKANKLVHSADIFSNKVPPKKPKEEFQDYIIRLLGFDGRLYQIWNKIYKTSVIKDNAIKFNYKLNFGEDLLFNLDYFKYINNINYIYKPLYIYNMNLDGGTYSKSSLVFKNRLINYDHLANFAGNNLNMETQSHLSWLRTSWLYSYLLAVSGSNMSLEEKKKCYKKAKESKFLGQMARLKYIGFKRFVIQIIIHTMMAIPILIEPSIRLSNFIKNTSLTRSIWQKLKP